MGLDASDVTLASGAMATSPLFCRGCRELQLSFSRIGAHTPSSHHACNPMCWSLQPMILEAATEPMHPATLYVPGDAGCASLASALDALEVLEVLELQDCGLGDAAACALADALTATAGGGSLGGARSVLRACSVPSLALTLTLVLTPDSATRARTAALQPCSPNPNQASVPSCGVSRSAPTPSQTPAARRSPPRC